MHRYLTAWIWNSRRNRGYCNYVLLHAGESVWSWTGTHLTKDVVFQNTCCCFVFRNRVLDGEL